MESYEKARQLGQLNKTLRDPEEVKEYKDESLRIVPPKLWERVQARFKENEDKALRFSDGTLRGRPPKHGTRNLLAGLAMCGFCEGALIVEHSGSATRRPIYICHTRKKNSSCANFLRIPVDVINEAVLQAIEDHALSPEAIESVMSLYERDDVQEKGKILLAEHEDVSKRLGRLVDSMERGESTTVLGRINELEEKKAKIEDSLNSLQPMPRLEPKIMEDLLAEWRRLLRSSPTQARAVINRIIEGRIMFIPRKGGKGYDFRAKTRFDRLFSGVAVPKPKWVKDGDRRGTEHIGPDDTFDGDYGRLLEKKLKNSLRGGKSESASVGSERYVSTTLRHSRAAFSEPRLASGGSWRRCGPHLHRSRSRFVEQKKGVPQVWTPPREWLVRHSGASFSPSAG